MMTPVAPTISQIRAQVASIRKKRPDARVIAIHTKGRWTGPRENRDGDHVYVVDQCDSPLAMRLALRQDAPESGIKILLTPLEDLALGDDLRVRLPGRSLYAFDEWQVLQTLFQAHQVDPRLKKHATLRQQLLAFAATNGVPAAPGGFLDLETAWGFLLDRGLDLAVARPDLQAILKWSLSEANVTRFKGLADEFRTACVDWLTESAGDAARWVVRCAELAPRPDALPVGLAALVVFDPQTQEKLDKAAVRLEERCLGGETVDPKLWRSWGEAARDVVRYQLPEPAEQKSVLARSDAILKELGADGLAHISTVSPNGFTQRLSQFQEALEQALETGDTAGMVRARTRISAHEEAKREPRRLEQVDMAVRLVRWLRERQAHPEPEPESFAHAVQDYLSMGSFIDWARSRLPTSFSGAYMALFKKCQGIQEDRARIFARLLQDWTATGSKGGHPIPVEQVLSRVVAPLSGKIPVLLIVMDGMSTAVFNQLVDDITGREWTLLRETNGYAPLAGVATIPSVTEFSRTSLLCGELKNGNSAVELAGFAQHPDLLSACKSGRPPLLFHKADIRGVREDGLLPEMQTAIAHTDNRVVGVVINAVDDYLLKGDQLDIRWKRDSIRPLAGLLDAAKQSGRIVIMTSDHGHVLESGTVCRLGGTGDRWRSDDQPSHDDELILSGHRVVVEPHQILVPWSESVRYASKKNGYHGGANPQEMVVPIAVLSSGDEGPTGWVETVLSTPSWWLEEIHEVAKAAVPATPASPKRDVAESLLDWREEDAPAAGERGKPLAWVAALLKSSVFEEQKKLAGRAFPKNENVVEKLLVALDRNGGKMTSAALAKAIAYPPMRLGGLLAVCQRVLNLDGYDVIRRDEDSDTIELNLPLLRRQFELEY
jgi:hypothetical protein